ncbi:MAG: PT domain-containing protein [Clostridia bacterium]|nr:PT domain-containing protein [Clostridia bacterium]
MTKRFSVLITVVLALSLLLAACGTSGSKTGGDPTKAPAQATEKPTDAPEPTAEPTPTAAPTDTPAPANTPEPKPQINYTGNAVLVDLEDDGLISASCCDYEFRDGEPWLTIITDVGDNNITFRFGENVYLEDTPIFAFKYRIGYGQSIRQTNHFYAISSIGGPVPQEGMYNDIDFVTDLDWHIGIFVVAEAFPAAGDEWVGLRFPTVDTVGGDYEIAWFGAFESEEDVNAYDAAFNEVYGDKLVKAEKPKEQKKEAYPEKLVNEFEALVYDFEDASAGDSLTGYYGSEWIPSFGLRNSEFVDVDGSVALNLKFDAFYHDSLVEAGKGFTAKFDFKNNGAYSGNFGGFVMGWGDENNSSRIFYENAYGKDGAGSLVSNSGIGFDFRGGNKIYVYIVQWNAESNKRDVAAAEVETAVDFDAKMVSFLIEDDGVSKITVKADGTLLFIINYSNASVHPDAAGYFEKYYLNVNITDAEGNELAKSESALFSAYDSFAFGARARDLLIDNIDITTNK